MDISIVPGCTIKNLNKINILLGKNGCGKSTLLKKLENYLGQKEIDFGNVSYLSPERGGNLQYDSGIDQQITNNVNHISSTRNRNQAPTFRQQTLILYRRLELTVLREIEKEKRQDLGYTFEYMVDKINSNLDNIEIKRENETFAIYSKNSGTEKISSEKISSGEAELISLTIESLVFQKQSISGKDNILFLDEPDLHLHPDLQVRFMNFLVDLVEECEDIKIVLATHSTAILGALHDYNFAHIFFMKTRDADFDFFPISEVYKKLLPVFGAHPLSNLFNEAPIFLVEGDDDERIWQQVVRTSRGKVKLYPCTCGSVQEISNYEGEVKKIVDSIYDEAKVYSLRDRDDGTASISDDPPVVRFKLSCRIAENLLLSDEVLSSLGITFDFLKTSMNDWINSSPNHGHFDCMNNFKNSGYDRKNFDIKERFMTS